MASEVLSTETKFTPNLDEDELETILIIAKNEQTGRITPFELRELVRVYRLAPDLYEALFRMRNAPTGGYGQKLIGSDVLDLADAALVKARGGSSNEGE